MLSSDPVKNSGCNVMEVVKKVTRESIFMNAIEKHYFLRAVLANNPPIKLFALVSAAVHAPKEMRTTIRSLSS